jgi:hypothetical protein
MGQVLPIYRRIGSRGVGRPMKTAAIESHRNTEGRYKVQGKCRRRERR